MTHDTVARLVGTYGQLYMIAVFFAVLAFTLWPRKGRSLERAARIPLVESDPETREADVAPCCRRDR